jgi:hypothetical protein
MTSRFDVRVSQGCSKAFVVMVGSGQRSAEGRYARLQNLAPSAGRTHGRRILMKII